MDWSQVTIKQGIAIGTGACIGAGSVVTLKSKWWELDDNNLQKLSAYISDAELFLLKIKELKNK